MLCTCLDISGIDALTRESGEKSAATETENENEEFYAGDDPHEAEDEQVGAHWSGITACYCVQKIKLSGTSSFRQ